MIPVLRAFSVYFTAYGIQATVPSTDPGEGFRPIGALALAATAVSEILSYDPSMLTECPIGGARISHALDRRLHLELQ